jgi:methyl-accepting chemotaxis protein
MPGNEAVLHNKNRLPLNLAGRVALGVALLAALVLTSMLLLITDNRNRAYLEVITAHQLTQDSLLPAMLAAGLALVVISAGISGLIALRASFRYAGPLYRIELNLRRALAEGPVAGIPIRHDDGMQLEFQQFNQAVNSLRDHHDALRTALAEVTAASTNISDRDAAMLRLHQIDSHARF